MSRSENKIRWSVINSSQGNTKARQNYGHLLTTPERIVRDHRSLTRRHEHFETTPAYKAPWYKAVNWGVVFDIACSTALAAVLIWAWIYIVVPLMRKM